MSPPRSEACVVALVPGGAWVLAGSAAARFVPFGAGAGAGASASASASASADWAGLAEPMAQLLAAQSPRRITLVADGAVARHWLQAPPPGLRTLAELRELVQSRAEQLFGEGGGWSVAGDWQAAHPFVCAALPVAVGALASALARRTGARVRASTWLAEALAAPPRVRGDLSWLVVDEPAYLHVLCVQHARVCQLHGAALPPALDAAGREARARLEVQRAAALGGGLATEPWQWVHAADAQARHAVQPAPAHRVAA